MASQQVSLAPGVKRESAAVTAAGSASGNVIVEFDDTLTQIQIVTILEQLTKNVIEHT